MIWLLAGLRGKTEKLFCNICFQFNQYSSWATPCFRYWQLDMDKVGKDVWDRGVSVACEEYGKRMVRII